MHALVLATPSSMHEMVQLTRRRHTDGLITCTGISLVVENDCSRQRDPQRHVAIADCCLKDLLPRKLLAAAFPRAVGHGC